MFAAGFTRKAAPSACTRRFRDPRRSQYTPVSGTAGVCRVAENALDVPSIGAYRPAARDASRREDRRSAAPAGAKRGARVILAADEHTRRHLRRRTDAGPPGLHAGYAGPGRLAQPGGDL